MLDVRVRRAGEGASALPQATRPETLTTAAIRAIVAPLSLVAARATRRPGRWLLPALGLALATAFAGAVAAEGVIAGDQSARDALGSLSPPDRTVRVTWQGVVTPAASSEASGLLRGLGLGQQTEVVLLNPVRLSGIVVRPAAIAPLPTWTGRPPPGPCRDHACPMLVAGAKQIPRNLSAPGIRIPITGSVHLPSSAPLGFVPTATSAQPPVLLTGDVAGLEKLAGLSSVYRSHSWLAPLNVSGLHSWQLQSLERRLQRAQTDLAVSSTRFNLVAPFDGLDHARAEAGAAPRRLLLVGGGALAALALFVVLAAGGQRRDQRAELERLRAAGATSAQCAVFAVGESAWLSGVALIAGAAIAVAVAAILASSAGVPAGGTLTHSLVTPVGAIALVAGWLSATTLITVALLARSTRAADVLAVAALAALVVALSLGTAGTSSALPVLLAPLCCLAAGVVTFRGAAALLRAGERVSRRGPVTARLAAVGLARAPGAPSLAIAFVAVSVGLAGFALAYRATLLRGATDQAADRVPLDATVAPGPDFNTPLAVAPLARWRLLARGAVLPVRRTDATYTSGAASVTIPALGISAGGLELMHGWRASDGSAPLATLARRLEPSGPPRTPGPSLPARARTLSLPIFSPGIGVIVTADLRDRTGSTRQLPLGQAQTRQTTLRAQLPRGAWELAAIELDVPTGLEITNGHQNAESPTGSTQLTTDIALGPLTARADSGRPLTTVSLSAWRAVGAASSARAGLVRFAASGTPGIVRPAQPSDLRPVPVLVDPHAASATDRTGRVTLTVDGLPVAARVVGVLKRFPTLPDDAGGFVVADYARLSSALDAQLPGQGRADELWIATRHPRQLKAALSTGSLAQLYSSFRADVVHQLRSAPIARGVLGALLGASALTAVLALIGLLVALLGAARDEWVQRDLEAQGLGPRGVRAELRARLLLAGVTGLAIGLAVAALLTRLAVAGVRAAATVLAPRPALVTVVPLAELGGLALAAIAVLVLTSRAVR